MSNNNGAAIKAADRWHTLERAKTPVMRTTPILVIITIVASAAGSQVLAPGLCKRRNFSGQCGSYSICNAIGRFLCWIYLNMRINRCRSRVGVPQDCTSHH